MNHAVRSPSGRSTGRVQKGRWRMQKHCECNQRWGKGNGCQGTNDRFKNLSSRKAVVGVDETTWLAAELPMGMHDCPLSACIVVPAFDPKLDSAPPDFGTAFLTTLDGSRSLEPKRWSEVQFPARYAHSLVHLLLHAARPSAPPYRAPSSIVTQSNRIEQTCERISDARK